MFETALYSISWRSPKFERRNSDFDGGKKAASQFKVEKEAYSTHFVPPSSKRATWHLKCPSLCWQSLQIRTWAVDHNGRHSSKTCKCFAPPTLPVTGPSSLPSAFCSPGNTCAGLAGAAWRVITHYATNYLMKPMRLLLLTEPLTAPTRPKFVPN